MRKTGYRVLMGAAFLAAGCQTTCSPDCLTNPEELPDPAVCTGVEGLRLVFEKAAGDNQMWPVQSHPVTQPTVQLLTALLRTPVEGVPVTFTITGGNGTFTTLAGPAQTYTVTTDASGKAGADYWQLGATPGVNTVTATVDGTPLNASITGSPLAFTVTGTPAATMTIIQGEGQSALAGASLVTPLGVRVTDAAGNPAEGVAIDWSVTSGGGTVHAGVSNSSTRSSTSRQGLAVMNWVLGPAGGDQTVTATAAIPGLTNNPLTFTAHASALSMTKVAGDNQTGTVGQSLLPLATVLVADQNGVPREGVAVEFAVLTGGGSVTAGPRITDAQGIATASWVLGLTAGPGSNTMRATANLPGIPISGNPATFTASTIAAPAAQVTIVAGNGLTVVAGQAVSPAPAVRVTDVFGAPAVGVPVTFNTVAAAGLVVGSITGAAVTTDQNGVATLGGWTLARTMGTNQLTATVGAAGIPGNPVTFTATGVAGPPVIMGKFSGDNQSAPVNNVPEILPTVRLTDVNLNPVAGVVITFAVASGGGSVTGGAVATDAQGRARVGSWRLGPAAGANTLTATAGAPNITGSPLTFVATGFVISGAGRP